MFSAIYTAFKTDMKTPSSFLPLFDFKLFFVYERSIDRTVLLVVMTSRYTPTSSSTTTQQPAPSQQYKRQLTIFIWSSLCCGRSQKGSHARELQWTRFIMDFCHIIYHHRADNSTSTLMSLSLPIEIMKKDDGWENYPRYINVRFWLILYWPWHMTG